MIDEKTYLKRKLELLNDALNRLNDEKSRFDEVFEIREKMLCAHMDEATARLRDIQKGEVTT